MAHLTNASAYAGRLLGLERTGAGKGEGCWIRASGDAGTQTAPVAQSDEFCNSKMEDVIEL